MIGFVLILAFLSLEQVHEPGHKFINYLFF